MAHCPCGNIDTSSHDYPEETCLDRFCTTCRELDTLDLIIAATKSRLEGLMKARNKLHTKYTGLHKGAVSRFPFELVVHVFELVVEGDNPRDIRAYRRARLRLGAIARKWRKIAWSTASLWTTFPIDIGLDTQKDHLELALEWLNRSKQLPLHLIVDFSPDVLVAGDPALVYVGIMNRFSRRWSKLELLHWTPAMLAGLHAPYGAPALNDLVLVLTKNIGKAHIYFGSLKELPSRCWGQVPHMDIDGLSMQELQQLPAVAKQLQTLRVRVPGVQPFRPIMKATPDINKNLTVLDIEIMDGAHELRWLFGNVDLPALSKLKLKIHNKGSLPAAALIRLFVSSAFRLKKLRIHLASVDGEDLIELARKVPLLESLHLTADPDDPRSVWDPFFCALADTGLDSNKKPIHVEHNLLPSLKKIKYKGTRSFPWYALSGLLLPHSKPDDGTKAQRALEKIVIFSYLDYALTTPVIDREVLCRMLHLSRTGVYIDISVGVYRWPDSWRLVFDKIGQDALVHRQLEDHARLPSYATQLGPYWDYLAVQENESRKRPPTGGLMIPIPLRRIRLDPTQRR